MAVPAAAQSNPDATFEIPALPLLDAIVLFNRQSGIQITAPGGLAESRYAKATKGRLTPAQALNTMLAGTGLRWRWIDGKTVAFEVMPQIETEATPLLTFAAHTNSGPADASAHVLPEVVADGEQTDTYSMGTGADFGVSTIGEADIKSRSAGSGDANQLLKILPTVQFDADEGLATREDIMDLRPADISISGGRYYDNLVTLDGIDVNSRMDTTQSVTENYNDLMPASPQSIWVDTNLIGEVTVRDANVSAEYGRFTGGVLDIKTRAPKRAWGLTSSVSYTSDALTHFRISDKSRAALTDTDVPEKPAFEKWRYGVTVDVPVSSDVGLLIAYNRSQANVTYQRSAAYDNAKFGLNSKSDNFLAKFDADLADDLKLTGQVAYSPYSSEYADDAAVENTMTTKGGGLTGKMELAHSGESNWTVTGNFSHNDTGREQASTRYRVSSWSTTGSICTSTNCTIGGYGDLDQTQDTYGLSAKWSRTVGPGTLAAGVDYQHVDAMRSRPEDNWYYYTSTAQSLSSTIVCADGDSPSCVTGDYALTNGQLYAAYTAKVKIDSVASWAEYAVKFGRVAIRAGMRYDYESFLGNHTFAPRLSATYDLPWSDWSVSLGANRYYGRSMLAYALREQYPDNYTYRRVATVSGSSNVYSNDDWYMYTTTHATSYSGSNLKTPYSDELSAAVSGRVLGGALRVKGIYREGSNEFTMSAAEKITKTLDNGNTVTYNSYAMNNDGYSKYKGGSIEWNRTFGKHSITLNANYSKTSSTNWDYFDNIDDVTEGTMVAFNGEVLSYAAIEQMNQRANMASPLIINGSWTGRWLDDRLTTNVNVRYRNGYKRIEDTNESTTIDDASYDLYDYVVYPKSIDVNLNAQFEVIRSALGGLTLEARVANLLDRIPSPNSTATSQPWQFGRSVWFGATYRY
ncbi:MAG: TonB-dependent receptor [Novosphingobium sp.]